MESIAKLPCAAQFINPVNDDDPMMRNYYRKVKEPMDLNKITTKVLLHEYKYVEDWRKDMLLIEKNARNFHGQNSSITHLAESMINKFEKMFDDLFPMTQKHWMLSLNEYIQKLQEIASKMPDNIMALTAIEATFFQRKNPAMPSNLPKVTKKYEKARPSFIPSPIEPTFLQIDDKETHETQTLDTDDNVQDFWRSLNLYSIEVIDEQSETSPEPSLSESPNKFSVEVSEFQSDNSQDLKMKGRTKKKIENENDHSNELKIKKNLKKKHKKQKDPEYVSPQVFYKKQNSFDEYDPFDSDVPLELTDADYCAFLEAAHQLCGPDDQKALAALIQRYEPQYDFHNEEYPVIDLEKLKPETVGLLISFTKQKFKERQKEYPVF